MKPKRHFSLSFPLLFKLVIFDSCSQLQIQAPSFDATTKHKANLNCTLCNHTVILCSFGKSSTLLYKKSKEYSRLFCFNLLLQTLQGYTINHVSIGSVR